MKEKKIVTETQNQDQKTSRRDFIKKVGVATGAVAASAVFGSAPYAYSANPIRKRMTHGLKDNPESVQAIIDMRGRYHDLYNAKKIQELCDQLYAEDAAVVPPDHDVIFGRSAIKDYFQKSVDVGDVAFRIGIIEVHADDYTGFVIGNFVFYDRTGPEEVTSEGRTLETFRKEPDGSWKFTVDMWHVLDDAVIEVPLPR